MGRVAPHLVRRGLVQPWVGGPAAHLVERVEQSGQARIVCEQVRVLVGQVDQLGKADLGHVYNHGGLLCEIGSQGFLEGCVHGQQHVREFGIRSGLAVVAQRTDEQPPRANHVLCGQLFLLWGALGTGDPVVIVHKRGRFSTLDNAFTLPHNGWQAVHKFALLKKGRL
jgi:hypothetical protein